MDATHNALAFSIPQIDEFASIGSTAPPGGCSAYTVWGFSTIELKLVTGDYENRDAFMRCWQRKKVVLK